MCIRDRLSTIENANRIVVMDEGQIVEAGKHEELLKKNGYYAFLQGNPEKPNDDDRESVAI